MECISFRGLFFPPPPKREEGLPHPRKEGERLGSILFYLFFYCILMILNIADKILCSPYLSRILKEKPVAIFRITIFLAINMAFWNISNIESRQMHYSFCFCLFESLKVFIIFQSLIDLESIFVESLNIFKVGVSIIFLAGIFCPPPLLS